MIEDPEYNPTEFWTLSQKIIHGIIQSNKKMVKFTSDWKEACEFNAIVKVEANVRKFSPLKWDEARKAKKHSKVESYDKGIYEYVHLIAMRNIYNTIRDLTKSSAKAKGVISTIADIDMADLNSMDDFIDAEEQINYDLLEKRVGFTTEGEEDGE